MSGAGATRRAWLISAVGLVALGIVFHAEITAAIHVWTASAAYNHCFLILPMAAVLAWQRRERLHHVAPRPTLLLLPVGLVFGFAWFLADRLGVMEGRQLAAMAFVQLLLFSVLGASLYSAMAAPLLYLFFLVPFGGFLVPALQSFTTHFVVHGLDVLGIPNYRMGNDIEIPEGLFHIAEACAGLRFLISATAFSVFYACIIYCSAARRLLFVAVALFVPVIANGFRALGIVSLGHWLGSARAAATDHVLYGYLFFSIVLALLILLGLLFRDDNIRREERTERTLARPAPDRYGYQYGFWQNGTGLAPAALAIVLAAIFPLIGGAIDRAAAATHVSLPRNFPGCVPAKFDTIPPALAAAGGALRHFTCADGSLELSLAAFPPRSDPRLITDIERALSGQNTREAELSKLHVTQAEPQDWQLVFVREPPSATASAIWIGGRPVRNDLRTRAKQALATLFGTEYPPQIIILKAAGPPAQAEARLAHFLAGGGAAPVKVALVR